MGSLYLGGPTIQEVDGKMMMGLSIYGVNQWVVILPILRYIYQRNGPANSSKWGSLRLAPIIICTSRNVSIVGRALAMRG